MSIFKLSSFLHYFKQETSLNNTVMAERPYDIAVYGASGYTGKYVAAEVVKTCQGKKIAIAGRSKVKLEKVFDIIEKECGK